MKTEVLAQKLSEDLGIMIDTTRLAKYEARGVTRTPRKLGKYKDYTDNDFEKLRKVVLLSEFGVHLDDVRRYLMGMNSEELEAQFTSRIRKLEQLIKVAKRVWSIT